MKFYAIYLSVLYISVGFMHADSDAADTQLLIQAVKDGKPDLVQELLSIKHTITTGSIHASPDIKDISGDLPLEQPAIVDSSKVIVAEAKTIQINVLDEFGMSPLHYAVMQRHTNIVEALIRYGADVNICNSFKMMPIHYAAALGDEVIVRMLIAAGAHVSEGDEDGMTPLLYAIDAGSESVCTQLLDAHALSNAQNGMGETAVMSAVKKGNLPLVMLLVEYNPDLDVKNHNKRTAVDLAIRWGHGEITNYLHRVIAALSEASLLRRVVKSVVVGLCATGIGVGLYFYKMNLHRLLHLSHPKTS